MDGLAKGMGEEGEYAVSVGKLTNVSHNQWVDAAVAYQKERYPKMQLVAGKNEERRMLRLLSEDAGALPAYPNIKGFQGSSSNDAVGIGQAVEEAGLAGEITVSDEPRILHRKSAEVEAPWTPSTSGTVSLQARSLA